MQTGKITYTAKYNKRFFTGLLFFQYYQRWSIRILTLGGVFSFILAIGYLLSWNPFRFHSFPYFSVFYSVFIVALPVYLKMKIEKTVQNHPFLDVPIRFEISAEGLNVNVQDTDKMIKWGQLYRIHLHPKAWLFYGTPQSFFYIRKDELSVEQQRQIESWMRAASKLA